MNQETDTGFIMLRHVRCAETNQLWNHNYRSIRREYPDAPIMIIDDHSDQSFVKSEQPLENVEIVESRFPPNTAELLPYIYFLEKRPFHKAVIVHDGAFVQKRLDTETVVDVQILFDFNPNIFRSQTDVSLVVELDNTDDLLTVYVNNDFVGCFGCMSIITLEFTELLFQKYNLHALVGRLTDRKTRSSLERVFGILFRLESKNRLPSYMGCIHDQPDNWKVDFPRYIAGLEKYKDFPIFKVWYGR